MMSADVVDDVPAIPILKYYTVIQTSHNFASYPWHVGTVPRLFLVPT